MVDPSAPTDDARTPVAPTGAHDVLDDAGPDAGVEALVVTDTNRPWWLIGLGVVALAVVVALIGWFVVRDDNKSGSNATQGAVEVKDVVDYDPSGIDGVENPDSVRDAIDGDTATSWSTQTYGTPDFDGDKAGVGLVLDLGKPVAVSAVEVETDSAGWSAEVYAADTAGALLDDWGQPVATGADLPASVRLALPEPKTGRFVLLWITRLPERGVLAVAEVRVVS